MHPNDRLEFLVSGHPGSKRHMGGKSKDQRKRDKRVRRRLTVTARSATVKEQTRNAEGE